MRALVVLLLTAGLALAETAGDLQKQGDALRAKHKHREALELFLKADRLQPNDSDILQRIAIEYGELMPASKTKAEKEHLGRQALDAAQRAVKANAKNADAHLALSIIYGRIALYESARRKVELSRLVREEAETATRLDPRCEYSWHILGRWNYEMANLNPVLKTLAQTIYGKFPDASNEKAVEYFQKAITLQPDRVAHHVELGRAYLALGDKARAREELEKGLALPSTASDDAETKQRARDALKSL